MTPYRQRRFSLTQGNRLIWALPLVGVLLTAALLKFGFNTLAENEKLRILTATSDTQHSVAMFEQHTREVIAEADRVTRLLKFELAEHGKIELNALQRYGLISAHGPVSVRIADAKGDITASDRPFEPLNIADRQDFRTHAGRDQDAIDIGRPLVDTATGREVVQLTRRLNNADGSFGGMVMVSIPTAYFTKFVRDGEFGKHGNVELLGVDGVYRVRHKGAEMRSVESGDGAGLVTRAKLNPTGTYDATDADDGTPRIVAYQAMDGFPLIAAASRSRDEVLADFARYRNDFLLPRLTAAALFFIFLAIATILIARLQRHRGELRHQRHFLETLVDNIPSGVAVRSMRKNDFGQYVIWNGSNTQMVGTAAREALGKTVTDVMSPAYAGKVQEYDRQMLANPMVQDSIEVHDQPDGKRMFVHIIRAPIFDDDGNVEFIVTSATDITTEHTRTEQLELASKVFETTSDGIILSDADDRVLMVNQAFSKLTGFEPGEMVGRLKADSPFKDTDPVAYAARMAALRLQGHITSEVARVHKNGSPLSLWVTGSIVRNADGSVRNYVRVFTDISLLKETQRKLEQLASFDTLTGLPNRRLLLDRLEQATRRAQRSDDGLAVMFIDLDGFKQVNDTLGHDIGDLLLQEIAHRLQKCIRTSDSLGRLGGDEFAIVLEKATGTGIAAQVGDRILSALTAPFYIGGHRVTAGASIGIATYPAAGTDAASLLKSADEAMFSAKHAGRNRFRFSTPNSGITATNGQPGSA